jgi:glycosyltransferase involved in cell wall biosynthesis
MNPSIELTSTNPPRPGLQDLGARGNEEGRAASATRIRRALPVDDSIRLVEIINLSSSANTLLKNRVVAMRERGVDNRIICIDGPQVPTLRGLGIPVHTVHLPRGHNPFRALQAMFEIASYLRRERIHLVHTHCSVPGFVGRLAARLAGVPVIMHTVHGFHFHEHKSSWERSFYLQLERFAGSMTDMLLSQNRTDLEVARRHRMVAEARLRHIGNGIDLNSFRPARRGAPQDETITITCVARFEPVKNHRMLLEAVRIMKERGSRVRVWLVGEGPLRSDYERLCSEFGISDIVEFLGYRDDMPALLGRTDISVLTSVKEGIPRAVLEAMGMEVPVVATRVIGTQEAVHDGETGFMVELGDSEALASALTRLAGDRALREELGRRGREVALQDFDESVIVDRLIEIYRRQLSLKGVHASWPVASPVAE